MERRVQRWDALARVLCLRTGVRDLRDGWSRRRSGARNEGSNNRMFSFSFSLSLFVFVFVFVFQTFSRALVGILCLTVYIIGSRVGIRQVRGTQPI